MVRENLYKSIEEQIREKLEFVKSLRTEGDISASLNSTHGLQETIRESLALVGESLALETAKSLLNKLPKNYSALPELQQEWDILNE